MIKNDKQYSITKSKLKEFINALQTLQTSKTTDPFDQLMEESILSQIEVFKAELTEYDKLKNDKPNLIISSIENLPQTLIKVRIAKGLSQNDLAKKLGLKEQQIQRYESTNYESANFDRIICIAKSMNVLFEDTKLILNKELLEVKGYDPSFLQKATDKLQSRRSLFTV